MQSFFVSNFPLLCICISMGFIAFSTFTNNKKVSINVTIILVLSVLLSVIVYLEDYAKTTTDQIFLATFMCYLGYTIRPICLYFFVRLADKEKLIPKWVFIVTLVINAIMYLPALFYFNEGARTFSYYFALNKDGTGLDYKQGLWHYTSHLISALYLLYIIFISFKLISLKHKDDALMILTCSTFVVIAVVLESLQLARNLLNVTIAVSCVFYYLFINRDKNRRDAMTELFNRKTFYEDSVKFGKQVIGVIQIDMNCLKYINDTKGHEEGDKAIKCIAKAISSTVKRDMIAYRMGGDEFLILSTSSKEEDFLNVQQTIRQKVTDYGYSCSLGFAYKENDEDFDTLIKKAEEWMYIDKANFYKNNKIERRK